MHLEALTPDALFSQCCSNCDALFLTQFNARVLSMESTKPPGKNFKKLAVSKQNQ
jgi:hypothetical protein